MEDVIVLPDDKGNLQFPVYNHSSEVVRLCSEAPILASWKR